MIGELYVTDVAIGKARLAEQHPKVIDRAAPPIRPERHVAGSIASVRRRLTVALARRLEGCPCCARHNHIPSFDRMRDADHGRQVPCWSEPRDMKRHHLAHQTFTGPEDLDQAIQEASMKLNHERSRHPLANQQISA